jgi:lysophospholipase L1-like esterase
MKTLLSSATKGMAIIALYLMYSFSCNAQLKLPDSVHRIVFLGNSITYAGSYITDIEAYIITHYPKKEYEFINVGLPSETVSGLSEPGHADGKFPRPDLHERLNRVLTLTKPDLVFICYGMNDGIYMPLDSSRFQKFKDGLTDVHNRVVQQTGATIIHLTPPYYDELKGKNKGYEATLDTYTDWVMSQQQSAGWNVIDIHYSMKLFTQAHRKVDSAFGIAAFALAEDGVHPGEAGHWIMAKQVLLYLGEKAVATAPDIHAALDDIPQSENILNLVAERQSIMKDAWLTAAGHKRPLMNIGISLDEAKRKYAAIEKEIQKLLQ